MSCMARYALVRTSISVWTLNVRAQVYKFDEGAGEIVFVPFNAAAGVTAKRLAEPHTHPSAGSSWHSQAPSDICRASS